MRGFGLKSSNQTLQPTSVKPSTERAAAVVMSRFDFMREFSMFTMLAAASGGSALSR